MEKNKVLKFITGNKSKVVEAKAILAPLKIEQLDIDLNLRRYSKIPGEIIYFEGKLKGTIVLPKGSFGFGYDQIFVPNGFKKTMSEMKSEGIFINSPRGIAITKLKKYLKKEKLI